MLSTEVCLNKQTPLPNKCILRNNFESSLEFSDHITQESLVQQKYKILFLFSSSLLDFLC